MPLNDRSKSLLITVAVMLVVIVGGVLLIVNLGSDNGTGGAPEAPDSFTVIQTVAGRSDLTIYTDYLSSAGLVNELSGTGPFTLIAPTNDAFAKLDQEVRDFMDQNPEYAYTVLRQMVVPGDVSIEDSLKVGTLPTLTDATFEARSSDGVVTIGEGVVQDADIVGINGRVHTIDTVLQP